jgi:serine/threonine-protein kinase RsbW
MSMWWCLQLRREASSVPLARRLLLGAMDTAGVEEETSYELSLALTEACANAVEHGTGECSDAYRVTVHLDGDRCRIEVADSGPGFRRTTAAAPTAAAHTATAPTATDAPEPTDALAPTVTTTGSAGSTGNAGTAPANHGAVAARPVRRPLDAEDGRGLFLIESFADHVRVRNRPGRGGAVITFDKALKWQRAAHGALLEAG